MQLAVPIYQGGFVESQVRQAIALQEKARQDLEFARRTAFTLAQTGYTGVISAVASVKAFEQAVVSAESRYQSNKLGQEVGVRTNLDVLNVQQNVYSTRRDLAQAYFNYMIGVAAAQGGGRHADRHRSRGHQPPAPRLTVPASAAASLGASHAHSRSAAPRCAAWKASAASRIRCAPRAVGEQLADVADQRVASATSSAAPAASACASPRRN